MIKYIKFLVLSIIISCAAHPQGSKKKINFSPYHGGAKLRYKMSVPTGYSLRYVEGIHEKETHLIYQDSSIIYLTSSSEAGSYLNYKNVAKLGKTASVSRMLYDSLNLLGIQENGLRWREMKFGEISVGYLNVPEDKIEVYNASLNSVKMRK